MTAPDLRLPPALAMPMHRLRVVGSTAAQRLLRARQAPAAEAETAADEPTA